MIFELSGSQNRAYFCSIFTSVYLDFWGFWYLQELIMRIILLPLNFSNFWKFHILWLFEGAKLKASLWECTLSPISQLLKVESIPQLFLFAAIGHKFVLVSSIFQKIKYFLFYGCKTYRKGSIVDNFTHLPWISQDRKL